MIKRKHVALILCLVAVLFVIGCGKKDYNNGQKTDEISDDRLETSTDIADEDNEDPRNQSETEAEAVEPIGMPNPVVEYASLEEINEMIDVQLLKPSNAEVSDERYSVIDDRIAQYTCEIEEREWVFRAAHITDEDISGINNEYNVFAPNEDSGLYANEFYLDRFFDGDKQYTIVVRDPISEDGDLLLDEERFTDICMNVKNIQKYHMDDPFVGSFQNTTDERMVLYVERWGKEYYASVNLNVSDNEFKCWTLGDVREDGDRLTYRGEEIGEYTYDEDGNEISSDVTAINNIGYFELKDEKIYWTGAGQEECRSYVFEEITYDE